MKTLFTSDLHIGHAAILKFEPKSRPFSDIIEHDNFIRKTWNYYVNDCDIVYILGDIGMRVSVNYLVDFYKSLNGNKVLILGNHDKYTMGTLKRCGFDFIFKEAKLQLDKNTHVKLSHYPYFNIDLEFDHKHEKSHPLDEGEWLLHGHTHSNGPKIGDRMINVGWDHWERPVGLSTLTRIINEK